MKKESKTKRIKRVFSNARQVLHLWANQTQQDARSKNVYFENKSCYSYGRHYELGRLVEYKGVQVALINDVGYSSTTNKHIHWAYDACSHLVRLKTKSFTFGTSKDVLAALIREQGELIDRLFSHFSQRSFYSLEAYEQDSWLGEQVTEFNKKCQALKHKDLTIDVNQDFKDLWLDHKKLALHKEELGKTPEALALAEVKRQKREALALAKIQDQVLAWRQGTGQLPSEALRLPTMLRVKENEVQTSRGASVPLDHAVRLLKLIESGKVKQGERVGHFTFNQLNNETVVIGCHQIPLNEARKVLAPYITKIELVK